LQKFAFELECWFAASSVLLTRSFKREKHSDNESDSEGRSGESSSDTSSSSSSGGGKAGPELAKARADKAQELIETQAFNMLESEAAAPIAAPSDTAAPPEAVPGPSMPAVRQLACEAAAVAEAAPEQNAHPVLTIASDAAAVAEAVPKRNMPPVLQLAPFPQADVLTRELANITPLPVHPYLQASFSHFKKGQKLARKLNEAVVQISHFAFLIFTSSKPRELFSFCIVLLEGDQPKRARSGSADVGKAHPVAE
jgi:hypothetical protein